MLRLNKQKGLFFLMCSLNVLVILLVTVRKVLRTHSAWGQIQSIFSLEKKEENYYYT